MILSALIPFIILVSKEGLIFPQDLITKTNQEIKLAEEKKISLDKKGFKKKTMAQFIERTTSDS